MIGGFASGLVTALAVGFLFAGIGAVAGAAARSELGEGGLADGTTTLRSGLSVRIIQLGQERCELRPCLCVQERTQLIEFGESEVQGNHEVGVLRIACHVFR